MNELRVEFGRILFDMIRYDLMEEITASLSHVFDEFVKCGCIERPSIRLLESEHVAPKECEVYLSDKLIGVYPPPIRNNNIHKNFLYDIYKAVERAPFNLFKKSRLPHDFLQRKAREGSRESCLFLYRYFLIVEDDRQQAFHWLKKLAAFGVPEDLKLLSNAYWRGTGCRKDEFLSDKYGIASGRLPRSIWRNKKDLF
ncbi:MAG: hypothetical protein K6G18_07435 [Treponema sp.]|nr:hypothetical protein [Treponema sp.]